MANTLGSVDFRTVFVNGMIEALARAAKQVQAAAAENGCAHIALRCEMGGDGPGGLFAQHQADEEWSRRGR